jgi:hypothetical protein
MFGAQTLDMSSSGHARPAAANEGYARAHTPRPFRFPDDHGPHPEFRTEWWYFTGNLDGADGRPFGYQLTFFRIAQSPKPVYPDSPWRANTLYMAHFTVSDIAEGAFHDHERLSRGAMGLAGAESGTLRLWLDDWSAAPTAPEGLPVRLRAAEGDVAIDLRLARGKPPVAHGDRGLPEERGSRQRLVLLFADAHADRRRRHHRTGAFHGLGPLLDGSGVEHECPGPGSDRVGLVRTATLERTGADVLPLAAPGRQHRSDSAGTIVLRDGTPVVLAAGEVVIDTLPPG